MPSTPYIIAGRVFQSNGTTPSASNSLVLRHDSSGETLFFTTDADGYYIFDLANLTTYSDGNYFTIIATGSNSTSQDLRMRIIARDTGQISEIKVKYAIS